MITPDRIRAFLDDLALISVKHDMTITAKEWVEFHDGAPSGYTYSPMGRELEPVANYCCEPDDITSLHVSNLTAHQRVALERSLAEVRDRLTYKSDVLAQLHRHAVELHEHGAITDEQMRGLDALCLSTADPASASLGPDIPCERQG